MFKLFVGEDSFGIKKEIETLSEASGAEIRQFSEEQFRELSEEIKQRSFLPSERIFVANRILSKIKPSETEELLSDLNSMEESLTVIFSETEKPKGIISEAADKSNQVKLFPLGKNFDVTEFIKTKIKEEGGEISPLAAERLSTYVGPDPWQLSEEIKKLVLYKIGPEIEPIEVADVDELVKANFEANIFALTDAVATKNPKRAVELIGQFLENGENEIYLLSMIHRQFRNIALAKFTPGISEAKMVLAAKIHPFVAKKSFAQARNFSKEELIDFYQKLNWADLKLKSGFEPRQILVSLVT